MAKINFIPKMKLKIPAIVLLLTLGLSLSECSSDELPAPQPCQEGSATYDANVRKIIEESCSYPGCHDGAGGAGPGDFTSYETLAPWLDEEFKQLVIDFRDDPLLGMPPNKSAYPQTQKEQLTAAELEIMRCWIQNGFPKN